MIMMDDDVDMINHMGMRIEAVLGGNLVLESQCQDL